MAVEVMSSNVSMTFASCLSLLAACFFYRYLTSASARRGYIAFHGCKPPRSYPHNDPILGLDSIRDNIRAGKAGNNLARQCSLHQSYGNTYSSYFFTTPVINTIQPENIKAILSTNFHDYGIGSRRRTAFAPLLGHSIFQSDGAKWESSRAILRPCFLHAQVTDLAVFEPHISNLIKSIPKDGGTVDLGLLFLRMTADVATDFLFGESLKSLENPQALDTGLVKAVHDSQAGCETRWQLGNLAYIVPQPAFFTNVRTVHRHIQNYVNKALEHHERGIAVPTTKQENGPKRYVFLRELIKVTQERKVLQDELLTLFFAGSDTGAALLTNLFFVLSKRPDIWNHLRNEVQQLDDKVPSIQQLKRLEYVHYCLHECLRLFPVQPSNSRFAYKDTVLPKGGGPDSLSPIFVRKGTMIHFSTFALHRRHDLWGKDADEFRPERWRDEKFSWKYIPFLGGPRGCIGKEFALNEAAYTVTRLVQAFELVESRDPGPWVEGVSMACTSRNGAKVVMIPSRP